MSKQCRSKVELLDSYRTDLVGMLGALVDLEHANRAAGKIYRTAEGRNLLGDLVTKITAVKNGMTNIERIFLKFRSHLTATYRSADGQQIPIKTAIRNRDVDYISQAEDQIFGMIDNPEMVRIIKQLLKVMTPSEKDVIWDYLNAFEDMFEIYDERFKR